MSTNHGGDAVCVIPFAVIISRSVPTAEVDAVATDASSFAAVVVIVLRHVVICV